MEKQFASGGTIATMEDGKKVALTFCDMCGRAYKGDYGYEIHLARHKSRLSARRGLCASCAGKIVPIIEKALDDAKEKEDEVRAETIKGTKNERPVVQTRLLRLEKERDKTAKKTMRVILKSGAEFTVVCDQFTVKKDVLGNLVGYEINGMTDNKVVYLDVQQIEAVIQYDEETK